MCIRTETEAVAHYPQAVGWLGWGLGSTGTGVGRHRFNNIAVFLKFQFAYFDVRHCRSTLPPTNQPTD